MLLMKPLEVSTGLFILATGDVLLAMAMEAQYANYSDKRLINLRRRMYMPSLGLKDGQDLGQLMSWALKILY